MTSRGKNRGCRDEGAARAGVNEAVGRAQRHHVATMQSVGVPEDGVSGRETASQQQWQQWWRSPDSTRS